MTRLIVADDFTREGPFQSHVVKLAQDAGWGITRSADKARDEELAGWKMPPDPLDGLIFHPRIMYRSEPGWPDLTLIRQRDRRLIFAELKTDKGKLSARQEKVLDLLRCLETRPLPGLLARDAKFIGPTIQVFVWRPAELADIIRVLA